MFAQYLALPHHDVVKSRRCQSCFKVFAIAPLERCDCGLMICRKCKVNHPDMQKRKNIS